MSTQVLSPLNLPPNALDTTEAARQLGVSTEYLRALSRRGRIKSYPVKVDNRPGPLTRFFDPADVEALRKDILERRSKTITKWGLGPAGVDPVSTSVSPVSPSIPT